MLVRWRNGRRFWILCPIPLLRQKAYRFESCPDYRRLITPIGIKVMLVRWRNGRRFWILCPIPLLRQKAYRFESCPDYQRYLSKRTGLAIRKSTERRISLLSEILRLYRLWSDTIYLCKFSRLAFGWPLITWSGHEVLYGR